MRRLIFLLILGALMASPSLAADTTAYIRCGCANDGDGTANSCAASPGGAGAYNTYCNWKSAESGNAYDPGDTATVYFDAESGTNCTESSECSVTAADADAHFLFTCAPGSCHNGTWDDNLAVIEMNTAASAPIRFDQSTVDVTFKQLQFYCNAGSQASIRLRHTEDIVWERNISQGNDSDNCYAPWVGNVNTSTTIQNNFYWDFPNTGAIRLNSLNTVDIEHNTFYSGAYDLYVPHASVSNYTVRNNISEAGTCFLQGGGGTYHANSDYNTVAQAAGDCTGNNDEPDGGNNVYSTTYTFDDESAAPFDLHINDTDACTTNDLSLADDIDGDARPAGDIYLGADEDIANACSGPPPPPSWIEKVVPRGIRRGILRGVFGGFIYPWESNRWQK